MTMQECYTAMGGDFEGVMGRLRSERLVQKFVLKFLDDGSYSLLCQALEEQNYQEAFRAAHTLKGVCQNLSIAKLGDSVSRLTEVLRSGGSEGAADLIEEVHKDYLQTAEAIRTYQKELT